MRTLTVESFAVCSAFQAGISGDIAVGLFSPRFPLRDGARMIQVAARSFSQVVGGTINVTVGRGDHRRDFMVRLAHQRQTILPALTTFQKQEVAA